MADCSAMNAMYRNSKISSEVNRASHTHHVPHIGWNQVSFRRPHPVFDAVPNDSFFYFVHSYFVEPSDPSDVLGETEYGIRYASICGRGSVIGVQFHPEKSQTVGLHLLRNFASFQPEMSASA